MLPSCVLQELLLHDLIGPVTSQTGELSISPSGVDPFLSQGGTTADSHARQNSADSGLGEFLFSVSVDLYFSF